MLHKLRILISTQHALMLAYRAEIYLWVLAHILPFIMMGIWTTAAASTPAGNFSMDSVHYVRYFIAVFAVRQFSTIWMIYDFEWYILEGRLSYLLLRPFNPLWHFVSAHLGEQLARIPFFIIVVATFFLINPHALWLPSPAAVILGVIAIYTAFALRFALQYCFAMLTFHFERASSIDQLTFLPYLFFSGMVIPLADLPPNVRYFVNFTPFPYMVHFPASILTGAITPADPAVYLGFAIGILWFLGLSALGALLWKRGLHQYSGQGV